MLCTNVSSLTLRVEILEARVPVSEGIGPFLTVSALAAFGKEAAPARLPPTPQVVHFDNLTSTQTLPDSRRSPVGPEPVSARPSADLPWIAQP